MEESESHFLDCFQKDQIFPAECGLSLLVPSLNKSCDNNITCCSLFLIGGYQFSIRLFLYSFHTTCTLSDMLAISLLYHEALLNQTCFCAASSWSSVKSILSIYVSWIEIWLHAIGKTEPFFLPAGIGFWQLNCWTVWSLFTVWLFATCSLK